MAQVSIYQLNHTPFIKGLASLLETILKKGHKIHIICASKEELEMLDQNLWTHSSLSFLPHGTEYDPEPAKQKIYISCSHDNKNEADIIVMKHNMPENLEEYDRLISMFDSVDDEELFENQIARLKNKEINYNLFEESENGWVSSKQFNN